MATSTSTPALVRSGVSVWKYVLWAVLFLAALSVLVLGEIPMLSPASKSFAHHWAVRWLLIPHAVGGTLAMVLGPLQFSTRLRQRYLKWHRMSGRVYVASVLIAAPLGIYLAWGGKLFAPTCAQGGAWFLTTLFALLAVRNRHIAVHRQWMIRSYGVTFTFIAARVFNPIPLYAHWKTGTFQTNVIVISTLLALSLPDIAFNWRELTTRRS